MNSYTSERVDPSYYQSTAEDSLIYIAHEKTYRFVSPFVMNKTVLDLGCGEGYGCDILSKHASKVVGVDVSSQSVERANTNYSSPILSFQCIAYLEDSKLPFADNSFDSVVCFHVIEHVTTDHLLVQEIRRVLKPDGIAFLSTPNASFRLLRFQNPWNRFHVKEYTQKSLQELLRKEFSHQKFMGITLREPWLQFEKKRSVRNRTMLWPITNKLIPMSLRTRLLSLVWKLFHSLKTKSRMNLANVPVLDDVLIAFTDVDQCPTLFVAVGENLDDLDRRITEDNQEL